MSDTPEQSDRRKETLEAAGGPRSSLVGEWVAYLRTHKKYWMIPILVVLLAVAGLLILGGTAAAPFIYPLF